MALNSLSLIILVLINFDKHSTTKCINTYVNRRRKNIIKRNTVPGAIKEYVVRGSVCFAF